MVQIKISKDSLTYCLEEKSETRSNRIFLMRRSTGSSHINNKYMCLHKSILKSNDDVVTFFFNYKKIFNRA
jgi:hypothetical protein